MRLDKFICLSTLLSRSRAIEKINAGQVLVNGIAIFQQAEKSIGSPINQLCQ